MVLDDQEHLALCWENYQKNMSSGMKSLLQSSELADVTIAVDGKYLRAHKLILSLCSPYFRELFISNPCKHPIVFMKDVSYKAIKNILVFIYEGEVQVHPNHLPNLIKTAEALKIKGLTGEDKDEVQDKTNIEYEGENNDEIEDKTDIESQDSEADLDHDIDTYDDISPKSSPDPYKSLLKKKKYCYSTCDESTDISPPPSPSLSSPLVAQRKDNFKCDDISPRPSSKLWKSWNKPKKGDCAPISPVKVPSQKKRSFESTRVRTYSTPIPLENIPINTPKKPKIEPKVVTLFDDYEVPFTEKNIKVESVVPLTQVNPSTVEYEFIIDPDDSNQHESELHDPVKEIFGDDAYDSPFQKKDYILPKEEKEQKIQRLECSVDKQLQFADKKLKTELKTVYFTVGKKHSKIVMDGYEFKFHRHHNNKDFWQCTEHQKEKCKVRLLTSGSTVQVKLIAHTHKRTVSEDTYAKLESRQVTVIYAPRLSGRSEQLDVSQNLELMYSNC